MTVFQRIRRLIPGQKPKPVRIVTDSTADLPAELVTELGITVIPLQVIFGSESFRDGVDLTAEGIADPVLSAFGPRRQVFQWHEDAAALPAGAVHLASSKACEVQAFRFGERAYAFQFHLEVDRSLIERWLNRAGHQPLLQEVSGTIDPEQIRELSNGSIKPLMELSNRTFSRWIDRFEIGSRRRNLPSR